MPPIEPTTSAQSRVRFLLIVLAVAATGALIYAMWPAAAPGTSPSNQGGDARRPQVAKSTQGSLEVRLEELKQPPAGSAETTRNPFRFYVKPPPPPPPRPVVNTPPQRVPVVGDPDYRPPPPPPIPIKFFGVVEEHGTKWAIFSDGKGQPFYAKEGQVVLGQYKLLKIGVESVTMSYLDGRGVQTIPMRGGQGQ